MSYGMHLEKLCVVSSESLSDRSNDFVSGSSVVTGVVASRGLYDKVLAFLSEEVGRLLGVFLENERRLNCWLMTIPAS